MSWMSKDIPNISRFVGVSASCRKMTAPTPSQIRNLNTLAQCEHFQRNSGKVFRIMFARTTGSRRGFRRLLVVQKKRRSFFDKSKSPEADCTALNHQERPQQL